MTATLRPDEIEARACRAMLAALTHAAKLIDDLAGPETPELILCRRAIAQAEAAGIKAD